MKNRQQIYVSGYFAMHQILEAMLEISESSISLTMEKKWPSNEIIFMVLLFHSEAHYFSFLSTCQA